MNSYLHCITDELADLDVPDDGAPVGVFRTHYGTVGDERVDEEGPEEDQYQDLEVNLEVGEASVSV